MEKNIPSQVTQAVSALNFIIPILEKHNFKWAITGGFACLAYGVDRALTDIDIDIDTSQSSPEFFSFLKDVAAFTTQPLEHYIDQNYDDYNFEVTYQGQVLNICPMAEMNVFDRATGVLEHFYKNGFPEIELVNFHGVELPLLSKELIIKNKQMLVWQRESDQKDIAGLKKLLEEGL